VRISKVNLEPVSVANCWCPAIALIAGHRQPFLRFDTVEYEAEISHIVARMLENSPFTSDTFAPYGYVADLPSTQLPRKPKTP